MMSNNSSRTTKPMNALKNATPFNNMSKKFIRNDSDLSPNNDLSGTPGAAAAIIGLILSLAFIGLQIYILYYTFKLERIGCECARDFRLTYAQVYIILSFVVYVALGVIEALTDRENVRMMAIVKSVIQGVMFLAGIVYVVFVWQYISRLRRIKCACSTSLARDIWEVVNYIQAAILFLTLIFVIITILYTASVYQSMSTPSRFM